MAKYEEEMKAAGRSINPQASYDAYYEGAVYDPTLGHEYEPPVPGAGLPGLADSPPPPLPFELPLPNPPSPPQPPTAALATPFPAPHPPAPKTDLPHPNGKPSSPTKRKEEAASKRGAAAKTTSGSPGSSPAWAKKPDHEAKAGFVMPAPLPATRDPPPPAPPASTSADLPRVGATKKPPPASTERTKERVVAPAPPLRSVRKQIVSPKKPATNEWLTVKKGDVEKETIELPEGATPQAGGTSPPLESRSGFEALESQKRESLDEAHPSHPTPTEREGGERGRGEDSQIHSHTQS